MKNKGKNEIYRNDQLNKRTRVLTPPYFTAAHGQGVYIENNAGSAGASVSETGVAASANTGGIGGGASAGAVSDNSPALNFGGSSGEASIAGSSASASSGAYAGASASAGAGAGAGTGFKHGGRPDYDRIFNVS